MSINYCSRCKKVGCRGFYSSGDFPNYNKKWVCISPDKDIPEEAHLEFQTVYDRFFETLPSSD